MTWNSKHHGTVGIMEQKVPVPWRQLFRGTYCSVVLTVPRHLNFHQFDQIKVALDQILRTFIKSVENKVARDQIGGNLGGA